MTKVAADENGKIAFGPISYTEAGRYSYSIREEEGSAPGITYDGSRISVDVTVTYDQDAGTLKAEAYYPGGENGFTFTNRYRADPVSIADLVAKKTVSASEGNRYEMKGGEFAFTIAPADGNPEKVPIQKKTVRNDSQGNVTLAAGATYETPGTYRYTVKEENTGVGGIAYDSTSYEVTVTVTDDAGSGKLKAETKKSRTR